jgi:tRNA A-37 threonylcarbamoyl transferase component Bud32
MNQLRTCPECGTTITETSEAELCPGCLLRMATNDSVVDPDFEQTHITPKPKRQRFEAPEADELNDLFPNLEILKLVGRGGMGAVYKARQPDLDRFVAVKILPREIQGDPGFGDRFLREARTLAKLNHPNIVAVYDFGQIDELFYFVMEFVDGVTLRDTIAAGSVAPEEALRIIPSLCDALQFAHEEGIVHRDIKPENILLDKRGRVKIADFGLAKLLNGESDDEQNLTGTHQVMGTVKYMAPEQMTTSRNVDHRADIYSLGVVFYELLTGDLPVGWFAPPSKKVAIDVRLDEVVLRTLEAEPSRRYQHASEVKSAVEELSLSGPIVPSAVPPASCGSGIRIHKLMDDTERKYRTRHHIVLMASFMLVPVAFPVFRDNSLFGIAILAAALVLFIWAVRIKKHLVWETTYKGHTIRLDCSSMLAEQIYLDDGLVQRGGFGTKMEFRTKIKAGDGIGDEIIIWFDAQLTYCRCRIDVEEQM